MILLFIVITLNANDPKSSFTQKEMDDEPPTIKSYGQVNCAACFFNNNSNKLDTGKDNCPCGKYQGKKLKECLHKYRPEERKELLKKLSPEARRSYVHSLDFFEYEKFVQLFSETEWTNLLAFLTPEERRRWPRSVKEQRNKIIEIASEAHKASASLWELAKTASLFCINPILGAAFLLPTVKHFTKTNRHPITDKVLEEKLKNYIEKQF